MEGAVVDMRERARGGPEAQEVLDDANVERVLVNTLGHAAIVLRDGFPEVIILLLVPELVGRLCADVDPVHLHDNERSLPEQVDQVKAEHGGDPRRAHEASVGDLEDEKLNAENALQEVGPPEGQEVRQVAGGPQVGDAAEDREVLGNDGEAQGDVEHSVVAFTNASLGDVAMVVEL